MPKNEKRKRKEIVRKVSVGILIGGMIAFVFIVFFSRISKNLFLERSANTQLLVEQIARNLRDSLNENLSELNFYVNSYESQGFATLDESVAYLKYIKEQSSQTVEGLYLVDEKSVCYTDDGESFRWRNTDILASGEVACVLSTTESVISNSQKLLFVMPLHKDVILEENKITHMILAVPMDVIDSFFEVSYYGEGSVSFLLNANGSQVYRNSENEAISKIHNVLLALQDARFNFDSSLEQVQNDINKGEPGCVHITFEGQRYYLAYEPLKINNWMAAMLINEENIAGASEGFVSSLVMSIGVMATIALVAIVSAIIVTSVSANKRLVAAAEAEKKANEAKTRFLSAMSHDIRTPMNAIIGMTNLAEENIENQKYALECLSKVRRSSDHLLTLINDVLDISKVESGKMRLSLTAFSLEDEVKRLIDIVNPQIKEKNQEFTCKVEGLKNKIVHADKLRINQVMLNILSNAVKYTQVGGKIQLEIQGQPNHDTENSMDITYCVTDNGMGMTEEFQKNMYDTFSRENDGTGGNIQGSGLGLAICKQMIELMGGTIDCKSKLGVGTTFSVRLTLKMGEDRTEEISAVDKEELDLADLCGLKILVAEDNDFNWEVATAVLEARGIETVRAENGQVCVDLMTNSEDGAYDLVLMDIQMPLMNGYQATEKIRTSKREYLQKIPIIAMTADAFSEDIHHCLEVGMNAHISKPIDVDNLLSVIKNHGAENPLRKLE